MLVLRFALRIDSFELPSATLTLLARIQIGHFGVFRGVTVRLIDSLRNMFESDHPLTSFCLSSCHSQVLLSGPLLHRGGSGQIVTESACESGLLCVSTPVTKDLLHCIRTEFSSRGAVVPTAVTA